MFARESWAKPSEVYSSTEVVGWLRFPVSYEAFADGMRVNAGFKFQLEASAAFGDTISKRVGMTLVPERFFPSSRFSGVLKYGWDPVKQEKHLDR